MSQPITWRNVTGPSPSEASRPLEVAGNSFNNALGGLGQLMSQQQSLDKINLANTENRMRQAYLNQLAGASSPDQLEQMKRSGALGVSFDSLDPASQAAVRGAADARLTDLRQGVVANNQYNDMGLDRAEKPMLDEFGQLIASKQFGKAREWLGTSTVRNKAALANSLTLAERADIEQGRKDEQYKFDLNSRTRTEAEAVRAAAEADRQRKIAATAEGAISGYQADTARRATEVAPLLEQFNKSGFKDSAGGSMSVSRNADGSFKLGSLGPETRDKLESFLADNNSYSVDELVGSDTTARARVTDVLRKAGARTTDLANLDPVLTAGLTTVPQALTGNDLAAAERKQRLQDAASEEASRQFVRLSDKSGSDAVFNSTAKTINDRFGADSWKAEEWRKATSEFLSKGIEARDEKGKPIIGSDGKPIMVVPNEETMQKLLSVVDSNTAWGNAYNRSKDLRKTFEEYLKDPAIYAAAGNAVNSELISSARKIDPLKKDEQQKKK